MPGAPAGGLPTDLVEQPGPGEGLGHRHRIGWFTSGIEPADRLEHVGMGGLVEMRGDDDLEGVGDGIAGEQHGPQ